MTSLAPIDGNARIGELDVLRGFALLGVFIVHFVGAAFYELPLDERIAEAWWGNGGHFVALFISDFFFLDKANTLFATLFGMGFWLMLQRLEASGRDLHRIYLRRLAVLLLIGLVNLFLLFPGDVLHEYALLGFLLFAVRGLAPRWMLIGGLVLALLGRPLAYHLLAALGATSGGYDQAVEAAFAHGGYWNWVAVHAKAHVVKDLANGMLLGWATYIVGRFLLGAWIMRGAWIERAVEARKRVRAILPWILASGLLINALSMAIFLERLNLPISWGEFLHILATPLLALGYALTLILLFNSNRGRPLASVFAPVGRIALTAYVAHGAILTFVYFPFGLDRLGELGPSGSLLLAISVFGACTVFAHLWLRVFRYGPLEYLWRWATYGTRPALRR